MILLKKIKLFITLIIVLAFLTPNIIYSNLVDVEAKEQFEKINSYGGPALDFKFIYKVVENLSNVIKDFKKGREFGTPGEHYARNLIYSYMEEIGLQNVHIDKITSDWNRADTWENLYNFLHDPDYHLDGWVGNLTLKKNFTKWYLHVKVYDQNNQLITEKNFSQDECFPFGKEEDEIGFHNVSLNDVTIVDDFKDGNNDRIVLIEADWQDPYDWWISNMSNLKKSFIKGFILMDCHDDTFFMLPSGTSSPLIRPRFSVPGFSINGSSGKWIKQYLNNPDYTVKADFCSEWSWEHGDSWNVVGEIQGRSPKVAIINDFYDGWWNQATFDEAVGVGLILGIAKYIIENNITPWYTLKFISWGAHEWYFRGAKHYLKTHDIKRYGVPTRSNEDQEDIIYVFNPGNIGFNYTFDMSFNVAHKRDDPLMKHIQKIAQELQYKERTGIDIIGEHSVYGTEAWVFYHGHRYPERYCKHGIEFDRFPYPGYHRDGKNHMKGDVFSDINDTLFRVDCEVIAEIILRLTTPKLEISMKRPKESSLYFRNFKLLNMPRKTFIYGPMNLAVEIDADNKIERVEFYIDNKLRKIDRYEPYSFYWSPIKSFARTIKIVAYDEIGSYADYEIEVFKWRAHPIILLSLILLISK